jgi:hypothetical protein
LLESLNYWSNKIWGKRKNQGICIYDPKNLLRSYGRLRIKGDNGFEEILEQKYYLLQNWGHVLTSSFGKNRSKRIKRDSQ